MQHTIKTAYQARKQQAGMTLLGMLLVCASLGLVAYVAMKVVPAYQQFYTVKMVMAGLNKEPLASMSKSEIFGAFERRADVAYVTAVKSSDLIIDKDSAGVTVATAKYQVVEPLFGNLSILLDFSTQEAGL
jgi:hypothetical protein